MFDLGASEILLIVVVAVVVIGPKDLPVAMRTAGRWIARMRRISGQFRAGIDAMVREAELQEMEEKWRKQNEAIMKAHSGIEAGAEGGPGTGAGAGSGADAASPPALSAAAEAPYIPPPAEPFPPVEAEAGADPLSKKRAAEPQLPLPPP